MMNNNTTNNMNESNHEEYTEVGSAFNKAHFNDSLNCKYYTENDFVSELTKRKGLSFMHINIASLSKHFESFNHLLNSFRGLKMIGVSETRINENNIRSSNYEIQGYSLLFNTTEAAAGGTALYLSDSLTFKPREDLAKSVYKSKLLESTFAEIECRKKANIIVGCLYKHPIMSIVDFNMNFLNKILEKISKEGKRLVLLGDFNINLLSYKVNNEVKNFVDILESYQIAPTINLPTRITSQSSTLIDNILVSQFTSKIYSGNLLVGLSDHMPQLTIISNEFEDLQRTNSHYYQDWAKFNEIKFRTEFASINWDNEIDQDDPNLAFQRFYSRIIELIDKNVPRKKLTKRQRKRENKPWITKGIKKSLNERDKMFRKFLKEKNHVLRNDLFLKYRRYRNRLVSIMRGSKKQFFVGFFNENIQNCKKIWEGVNQLTNLRKKSKNVNISINIAERIVSEPTAVANEFNTYFCGIAEKVRSKIPVTTASYRDYLKKRYPRSFFFRPTDKDEVKKIIGSLDQSKSIGPNSIPFKVLKIMNDEIATILAKMFNLSISKGKFIDALKIVKVVPIFKNKGSPLEVGNYRPISLLSNIDKIFEKLVHQRMTSYLEAKNILYKRQFGFRKKNSTTHSLICLTENIRGALEKGDLACGIFIDLQKAFDTVDHEILLAKLENYGFRGLSNDWIRSYLTGRKQFVHIAGKNSKQEQVKHGVPQGSVLGPLLFLIYINDLPASLRSCLPFIFADDTALLYIQRHPKALQKRINIDMKLLLKWLKANKISLNVAKTEIILFKHKLKKVNFDFKIKLDGKRLIFQEYVNYLGVLIDKQLSWSYHQERVATSLRQTNGVLSRIRYYLPSRDLRKNVYFALFHSKLMYAIQVWGQSLTIISRLALLQKSAIRLISFSNFQAASMPIFKELRILPIPSTIFSLNIKLAHKTLNFKSPTAIKETLDLQYNKGPFPTRSNCMKLLARPYIRTSNFGYKSIRNQTIINWNDLQTANKNVDLALCSPSLITKLINKFLDSIL